MSSLNIQKLNCHSHNTCYSPNPPNFNKRFLHLLHHSSQKHENHRLSFPVTRCLGLLGTEGATREAGLSVMKQKSSRIQQQLVTLPVPHSVYPSKSSPGPDNFISKIYLGFIYLSPFLQSFFQPKPPTIFHADCCHGCPMDLLKSIQPVLSRASRMIFQKY